MKQTNQKRQSNLPWYVGAVVLTAYLCRYWDGGLSAHSLLIQIFSGYLRSVLYIGLYVAWGVSIWRRIIQKQVRQFLLGIAGLMVFWFLVRTIRFHIVTDAAVSNLLWYSYYFPMLFIPLLTLFVALSLGKPEGFRLPGWMRLLYFPAGLLLAMILSNDGHELVFAHSAGGGYSYRAPYYISLLWMLLCSGGALLLMCRKCRIPGSRQRAVRELIPLVGMILAYSVLYVAGAPFLRAVLGDMTAVFCLLLAAILECCIQNGLICSNSGYDALFAAATRSIQITDKNGEVAISSGKAGPVAASKRESARREPVWLDRNTLLKGAPIRGGFVFWQEDVTELAEAMAELEENRKRLAEQNYLKQENYKIRQKTVSLQEKNRLYDLLQKQTAGQNALLLRLLEQYDGAAGPEKRTLLAEMVAIGAYIKRSGNLLLIRQDEPVVSVSELDYALEESVSGLELMGADCVVDLMKDGTLPADAALAFYRFFETVVEQSLGRLDSLAVRLRQRQGVLLFRITAETTANLHEAAAQADSFEQDGKVWLFTLRMPVGGAV